jgi:tetratricopeptide (TPR) repeat protein
LIDILRGRLYQIALLSLAVLILRPTPISQALRSNIEKAKIAAASGEPDAVYENLASARQLNPYLAGLQLSLSRAALRSGHPEEAAIFLSNPDIGGTDEHEAQCMIVETLLAKSDVEEAYALWERIQTGCSENPLLLKNLSDLLIKAKEIEPAINVLTFIRSLDTADTDAILQLGILSALKEPEDALPLLRSAMEQSTEEKSIARELVDVIEEARLLERKEISHAAVGQVLGRYSEWFLASIAFENAISIDPTYADAISFLGLSLDELGEGGLAQLKDAVELSPDGSIPHLHLALHWLRNGSAQLALIELETAARLDPTNPIIAAQIGQAYELLGDIETSLSAYRLATELAPQDATFWLLLAQSSLRSKFDILNIGLPASRNAVALDPNNASALDALGYCYYLLGDIDFAERFLKQSIIIDPNLANSQYHMGLLHLYQENSDLATTAFELAYLLDPEGSIGELARRALETLGQ